MPLSQGNVKVDNNPVKLKQFITPFIGLKPQIPIPKFFTLLNDYCQPERIDDLGHVNYLYRKFQSAYLTGQVISNFQIAMTKTFHSHIRWLAVLIGVLNFEFW